VTVQPGRGTLRLARTLLVATPSVTLSVGAHSVAGGCVTALGVLLTCAVLLAATWTQLSRQRSTVFLLSWLALGQALGHGLLEITCTSEQAHASGLTAGMLASHAAAVAVSAALLGIGERRVWSLARQLAGVAAALRRLTARLPHTSRPCLPSLQRTAPTPAAPRTWSTSLWTSLRPVRRGPPRLA
jgi:hypothetical protein